jgi:hypothetical protein
VFLKFNEMVPAGERSQLIQSLMMQLALAEHQKRMEAIAEEFATFRLQDRTQGLGGFRNDSRRRARQIKYADRTPRSLLIST